MATAPTGPLAWEPPYAAGAAQEIEKDKKKGWENNMYTVNFDTNENYIITEHNNTIIWNDSEILLRMVMCGQ